MCAYGEVQSLRIAQSKLVLLVLKTSRSEPVTLVTNNSQPSTEGGAEQA